LFWRAEQDEENDFRLASTIQEHLGNPLDVESSPSQLLTGSKVKLEPLCYIFPDSFSIARQRER